MEYKLIESEYDIDDLTLTQRILTNRGIKLEDIDHYLHTDDNDILDPLLLDNMETGAKMLVKAIKDEAKVMIIVDADCDGYTSASLLYNYLYDLFPHTVSKNFSYFLHDEKEHGINIEDVPEDIKLLIVPDAGSNDLTEHKILKDRGCNVLVIDHHDSDVISTDACIINNQLCDYPTKSLSGVGIVYKFCCYIDQLLNITKADKYLDLVALGMIADMSDLRDFETRRLITKGLDTINNLFFKEMVERQDYSLKGEYTPMSIAFYIAPYVNAMVRMGTLEEKTILFESMIDSKAYDQVKSTKRGSKGETETRVVQAVRTCINVKNRQKRERDQQAELIEYIIETQHLLDHKLLVIKLERSVNKNLTGLIANELVATYGRPTLLLNKVIKDGEIFWAGSGRNVDNSKITDLRTWLKSSGYFELVEGHPSAFGVEISDSKFDDFIKYSDEELKDMDFNPCYKVDAIMLGYQLDYNEIMKIANLKPFWGQKIDEAKIAIENLTLHSNNIVLFSADKNPTIKISLPNNISAIKFKSSKEEYKALRGTYGSVKVNLIVRCDLNVYNGNVSPQLMIEDYEIINSSLYDF